MNSTLKGILLAVLVVAIAIVALGATDVIHVPGLGNHEDHKGCGGKDHQAKPKACSGEEGHDHAEGEGHDAPKAETKDAHEGHDHAEGEGHDAPKAEVKDAHEGHDHAEEEKDEHEGHDHADEM